MKIYSYNNKSASALALCAALGVKRIKHEGNPLIMRETVINWGCSKPSRDILFTEHMPNAFDAVEKAANKLSAFKAIQATGDEITIPLWSEVRAAALGWIDEGFQVVCRTILNGHSGNGIVIANKPDDLVDAPLYTRYVKKKEEYRVHVHAGEVFFVQRKARDKKVADADVNWTVRNHHNGFIYANRDVDLGGEGKTKAILAVAALGLDFGAVDIILGSDSIFYVLEVNTAPGLTGTTLDKYVEQFRRYV